MLRPVFTVDPTSTQHTGFSADISRALLTPAAIFEIQTRVGGFGSVSWTRRVAAERPDCWTGGHRPS